MLTEPSNFKKINNLYALICVDLIAERKLLTRYRYDTGRIVNKYILK